MRIIADHIRATVFVLGDANAVLPSNVDRGYILRRLIRRIVRYGKKIGIHELFTRTLAEVVVGDYALMYPELVKNKERIYLELHKEEERFEHTLEKGLHEFEKMVSLGNISGINAFLLFQSYGFPLEMTEELAREKGIQVDVKEFLAEYEKHKELSREGAEKKFKGGLADTSEIVVKMHTATHLLNEALRKVISPTIHQRGSNITSERLRFDFNFDRKLTPEEVKKVEEEVNRVIHLGLAVRREEMDLEEAKMLGAQAEFGVKYPDRVSVYFVGDYSKEFCGGPHVSNSREIGHFKIVKEEAVAAGVRRIKAVVE
jgi:alanyl-tRNA synthetase